MGRKVSVGLEADVAGFIGPVEASVKATEKLDDKVDDLDDSLKKIPADAAKAGAALKLLDGDVGSVDKKISSIGEKNTGLATLDAKIRASQKEVRKLADEFVKTADVEVFKKLGEAEGKLRGLQDVRKKLSAALVGGAEDAEKSVGETLKRAITPEDSKGLFKGLISNAKDLGAEFGKNFSAGMQGVLSNPIIGPAIAVPLAAAVIAAMSFVGAAIGGAVLAGIGGAAAGGGLVGAWMGDPAKFSAQWNAAIDNVQHRWLTSSSAAFSKPLEDSLKEVGRLARDIPVERLLAISAPFVQPLAQGAGGGLTNLINGVVAALDKVQPAIDKLGPGLANLGQDVGDAFRMISQGSEGGAAALGDLVDGIGYAIRATALLILGFEKTYENIRNFITSMKDAGASIPIVGDLMHGLGDSLFGIHESSIVAGRSLHETGAVAGGLTEQWTDMARAGAEATLQTLGLNDALTKTRDTMLGMADANLAVAQGWLHLKEELDDGKKSLDSTTQAGIDNQKAILGQVELLERQRQQAIETGGGTADAVAQANAAYDAAIQKLKETARAAGFTDAQVDALLRSYGAMPGEVKTEVKAPGLSAALSQGISLGNALNRIDGQTYEAQVVVHYHTIGQSLNAPLAHGGIRRAALGMIIPPSNPGTTLVGEPQTGGEALIPLKGISQAAAMGLMRTAGAGYGINVSAGGSAAGSSVVAVNLSMKIDPGGRSAGIGPLVQQAFNDETIQVYANGQRVTVRR